MHAPHPQHTHLKQAHQAERTALRRLHEPRHGEPVTASPQQRRRLHSALRTRAALSAAGAGPAAAAREGRTAASTRSPRPRRRTRLRAPAATPATLPSPGGRGWSAAPGGRSRPGALQNYCGSSSPRLTARPPWAGRQPEMAAAVSLRARRAARQPSQPAALPPAGGRAGPYASSPQRPRPYGDTRRSRAISAARRRLGGAEQGAVPLFSQIKGCYGYAAGRAQKSEYRRDTYSVEHNTA